LRNVKTPTWYCTIQQQQQQQQELKMMKYTASIHRIRRWSLQQPQQHSLALTTTRIIRKTFASVVSNELYWSSLEIDEGESINDPPPSSLSQAAPGPPSIVVPLNSQYESIPCDVAELVQQYSDRHPTAVSLQMLIHTGKGQQGDLWGRTYHSASNKHVRTTSSAPNLMMMTSPHRRLGLDSNYSKQRIQIQMADFLRKELPIRLAHRIRDLDEVPHLRHMGAVQEVKNIYIHSFMQITSTIPPTIRTNEEEQQFAALLSSLYQNHASVLVQMAKGAYQLRTELRQQQKEQRRKQQQNFRVRGSYPSSSDTSTGRQSRDMDSNNNYNSTDDCTFAQMNECHAFLDRFYMSRIGIRFLAAQYITLRNANLQQQQPTPVRSASLSLQPQRNNCTTGSNSNYIGMIFQETSPSQCVRQAAMDASMMCRRMYGRCPRVDITGQLDLTFPYIPTYLHYIVLELLKNALRATMETHMNHTSTVPLPPVLVTIADGITNEDVVIKIADCGGGIPRSQMDQIWSYLFTTADPKIQEMFVGHNGGTVTGNTTTSNNNNNVTEHSYEAPLAGLGYGLPISRSYCRYFGGDLDIISMEGYGTDAFIYLKRLGDSKEPVPI
jgi:pyruvate dehydrogenase kinase 2/3/4